MYLVSQKSEFPIIRVLTQCEAYSPIGAKSSDFVENPYS